MTQKPEIKAVLFDLDDTLIDRHGAYNAFYRSFYDRHEAINADVAWPEAKKFFWTLSPNNATKPREAFVAIKERWPGVEGDPESHYHNYFKGLASVMRPLPGAVEFIEAMNSSGLAWGVVTNGNEYQFEKVRLAGLEGQIPFIVATELHGPNKPDPSPYLYAVKLLELPGIDHGEIMFVGDNPHTDIVGAHGIGMQTAWIRMGRNYPDSVPAPDLTIDHVSELNDLLGL